MDNAKKQLQINGQETKRKIIAISRNLMEQAIYFLKGNNYIPLQIKL